jgi:hypothetical protein
MSCFPHLTSLFSYFWFLGKKTQKQDGNRDGSLGQGPEWGEGPSRSFLWDPVFILRNAPYLSIRDKPSKQREQFPVPLQANSPTHTGQSTSPARQCDYALCACAHGWVPPAAMRPLHGCAVLLMCHRTAPHLACRCPLGTPLIFIPSSRSLVGFCCQHLVWEACLCRSHTIFWCCRAASCLPQPVTLWAVASGWCWPAAGCCLLTAGLLLVACAATPSQPEQSSA